MRTLYESLLDDEDELVGRTEANIAKAFFTDPNSPFFRFASPHTSRFRNTDNWFKFARFEKDTIFIPAATTFKLAHMEKPLTNIIQQYYETPIKVLKINEFRIDNNHSKFSEVTDDVLCPTIISDYILLDNPKKVQGIKFVIQKMPGSSVADHAHKFVLQNIWHMSSSNIQNIEVDFVNGGRAIVVHDENFISLEGIKSNARHVYYHDTFCLEDYGWPELFNNSILDTSYVCELWDEQKKAIDKRKMNGLKKVIATANNPKRYRIQRDPIIKVRKDCEIEKLFGLKNMKDVDLIKIWNNNVEIYIRKGHSGYHPDTYSKDGWQITIEKNRN